MLDWLYGLQGIGVKLGLENMRRLIDALDLPSQNKTPLTLHVAGTNGKGSVCACIDAVARAHSMRTGLFTSPHLIHFRERIRIDGVPIEDEAIRQHLESIRDLISDWKPHPSFFEVTLALALRHFLSEKIDCLVLETGLGGRLDATNALEPRHVSVITPIHYDHTHILGDSLDQIAREKAGIFRRGVPVISAAQPPEAELALRESAAKLEAPIEFIDGAYEGDLALEGHHQRANAALAVAAFRATGRPVDPTATNQGLGSVEWPARFQSIGSQHIIDGAHNPASIEALVETWRQQHGEAKATIIFGCAREKHPADVLALLAPIARRFIFTPIASARSENPAHLQACLTGKDTAPPAPTPTSLSQNLPEALAIADAFDSVVLITGSLFLAGEALAHLTGQEAPAITLQ